MFTIKYIMTYTLIISEAYLGGGHCAMAPPLAKKFVIWHTRKIGKLGLAPPLCVSTSGQRKFAPPFEILNTPLHYMLDVFQEFMEWTVTRVHTTTIRREMIHVWLLQNEQPLSPVDRMDRTDCAPLFAYGTKVRRNCGMHAILYNNALKSRDTW